MHVRSIVYGMLTHIMYTMYIICVLYITSACEYMEHVFVQF